jgi:hypothetical protein
MTGRAALELDTLTIRIPIRLQRRGGRKLIMTPEGAAMPAMKPRPDETLIKALVPAHRWRRRIESRQARSITDLAEQEGVTDAYVCRLLPLTCLAPDIVEAVLDGRQPKGLRLAEMLGNGPPAWNDQRKRLGFSNDATRLRNSLDCDHPLSRCRLARSHQPNGPAAHVVPRPEFKGGVDESRVQAFDAEGGRRNWFCEHWSVRRRRLVGNSDEDRAHSPLRSLRLSQGALWRPRLQHAARRQ